MGFIRSYFILFVLVLFSISTSAQTNDLKKYSKQLFDLAHEAYLKEDAMKMIDAIDFALDLDKDIRTKILSFEQDYRPESFFNAYSLYFLAQIYTPTDGKKINKRLKAIKKRIDKLAKLKPMGLPENEIFNENFLVPSGKQNSWDLGPIDGTRVVASIAIGEELWMDIIDTNGYVLDKDHSKNERKIIDLSRDFVSENLTLVFGNQSDDNKMVHVSLEISNQK